MCRFHYSPVFLNLISGVMQMSRKLWLSLLGLILVVWLAGCAGDGQKPVSPGIPQQSHFHLDGGWVSSGADILKDAVNPWWVSNTTDVNYCIAIDASTVKADKAVVAMAFDAAVKFWRKDFSDHQAFVAKAFDSQKKQAEVAQQTFHLVDCDKNPELKLVFGYNALTDGEKAHITDTDRLIARAMRTAYDRVNLIGRGIIYFASDSGPHALKQNTFEHPWDVSHVLLLAIAHEMGHVFGVPHIRANHESRLMADDFLEALFFVVESVEIDKENGRLSMVRKEREVSLKRVDVHSEVEIFSMMLFSGYFAPQIHEKASSAFFNAEKESTVRKFFRLEKNEESFVPVRLHYFPPDSGKTVYEGAKITANVAVDGNREQIALGFIDHLDLRARLTNIVNIKLTLGQKVYPNVTNPEHTTLVGAGIMEFFGPGVFHPEDKSGDLQVHVNLHPARHLDIYGQIGESFQLLDGMVYRQRF